MGVAAERARRSTWLLKWVLVLALSLLTTAVAAGEWPDCRMLGPEPPPARFDERGYRVHTSAAASADRLLLLGDEQLVAPCLDDEQTPAQQLASALARELDQQAVGFVDAAVPGLASCEQVALLEAVLPSLRPRAVVLFISLEDDLVQLAAGQGRVAREPAGSTASRLVDSLRRAWKGLDPRQPDPVPGPASLALTRAAPPTGRDPEQLQLLLERWRRRLPLYLEGDPMLTAARAGLDECLGWLARVLREQRLRGLVVVLPAREMLDQQAWELYLRSLGADPSLYRPERPRQLLESELNRLGLAWLDATPHLAYGLRSLQLRPPLDGQLDPLQARLLARATARALALQLVSGVAGAP